MRPGKRSFRVFAIAMVVVIMVALMPSNVSAHPVDLSGIGRFGDKVAQIVQDIGKAFSDININLSNDAQKQEQPTDQVKPPPKKTTSLVDPTKDTEIKSPSEKIKLEIPKGAVKKQANIEFIEYNPTSATIAPMINDKTPLNLFELNAKETVSKDTVSKFEKNLEIRIQHDPSEWASIDPDSLHLYYFDETKQLWIIIPSTFDKETNELIGTTNHFSIYGEQGSATIVGPGRIMASQVNLQSGTATYSYPLDLPAGPGGFQPKIEVTYNSGSADEMKSKLAVGSWVGIGWSLSLGQISYDATASKYYLDLNGASYEIVSSNGTDFYTNPEEYLKITRSSNTWDMYDKDGYHYQFGGTTESQQYINNSGTKSYYQWNLNQMTDTNGNKATVTYVQDIQGSNPNDWVRSAYPQYLRYGYIDATTYKMEVTFNTAYDETTSDGNLRYDNPITYSWSVPYSCNPYQCNPYSCNPHSCNCHEIQVWVDTSHCDGMCYYYYVMYGHPNPILPCGPSGVCWVTSGYYADGGQQCDTCYDTCYQTCYNTCYNNYSNPAPKVMEDRRLTSIDVKVGGSGGSLLRKYVFDYTTTNRSFSGSDNMYYAGTMKLNSITQKDSDNNLALPAVSFTYDNLATNYNNSPSFSWPHLTQVNSGYGGTISFAYTQIPSSPTTIWSREAVTTKTINSGIVTESPDYTYTGNPSYLGTDINQKFRGWNEVKETDDTANYTKHYFFTTGTIDGKDAEKLTGKEYKTQSYDSGNHLLKENLNNWNWESTAAGYVIRLSDVQEKTYKSNDVNTYKTTKTEYVYGDYGNVTTEKVWGDTANTADNAINARSFYANTTSPYYIVSKIKEEKVYSAVDNNFTVDEANLKKDTLYYYDGNNTSQTTQPTAGNLTRVQSKKDASNSISSYYTYDSYGNKATETDANGNTTSYTNDSTYHIYPITKTYPSAGGVQLSESCTYQDGTGNILTHTDVNGQVTQYTYDTFKRLIKVYKPGDTQSPNDRPSIVYNYSDWGSTWVDNKPKQRLETWRKVTEDNYPTNYALQYQFFDGLGRIIQTQSQGESGYTIVDKTTTFNNVGQVDKEYVAQNITTPSPTIYQAPQGKYTSYTYDALGRILKQYNIDGTDQNGNYTGYDYTNPWQISVRNPLGFITNNYYNAFGQMVKVEEPDASNGVYATTKYEYDTLGNLTRVLDANNSSNPSNPTYATTMTYDWLSHKTAMSDPDMGSWSYVYDNNGNLTTQTDAKNQTITMVYDALNRLTNKNYPTGSGMTNIVYSFDSTANGNYGLGLRTGMTDAAGTTADKYDTRGRLIEEKKTINSVDYTTGYTYDGLDRTATVVLPTGETVTNTYNGRGLPSTLSGSVVGNLVTSTLYNQLGSITQINLGNGLRTNYSYWGIDHSTTAYGKLWEIQTLPQAGGTAIQDMQYTWDANSNLTTRQNTVSSETENFTYDSLDRVTAVSGAYSNSYGYDTIGNITTMNGNSYTYSTKPHAVTAVGSTSYAYDANGNMTTRGTQTITWDVENRPLTVTGGASFVYDGDGNRVEKIENSETTLYINQYYEKNITTGVVTTSYYLGGQLVAQNAGGTLKYIHQDSLGSTSVMSTSTGTLDSSIAYFPFGATRTGSVSTDKEFTGQRLDQTGLYY